MVRMFWQQHGYRMASSLAEENSITSQQLTTTNSATSYTALSSSTGYYNTCVDRCVLVSVSIEGPHLHMNALNNPYDSSLLCLSICLALNIDTMASSLVNETVPVCWRPIRITDVFSCAAHGYGSDTRSRLCQAPSMLLGRS